MLYTCRHIQPGMAIFYSNPNSRKKIVKLYWVFQKLDHLTYNKILELV